MTFSRVLFVATMAAVVSIPAANAQFGGMPGMPGMGMPGMGGFGAPPPSQPAAPPAACQQLVVLRDEYQKNGTALGANNEKARTQHKPVDLVETCKLFKAFLATEVKFIKGLTDNQATCGVPSDVIKHYQEEHGKASQTGKQVCDAAEHPRQAGPTLSDALNSAPTLPDVDNTKRGRGTFDTLDGSNPLAR
jgi:hypothetical protein